MSVALLMDMHVPYPITHQLRRRGVDVSTARDEGCEEMPDDELLTKAHVLQRVVFTQDVLFRVLAQSWQAAGREFSGLLFGAQLGGTIGQYVADLELIANASEPEDWRNVVEFLPYRHKS
jgi:hypothetical protein